MKTITKAELCKMYGVGSTFLWHLLNVEYYDELVLVGYKKSCKNLAPKVVRKFIELHGEPIDKIDFEIKIG